MVVKVCTISAVGYVCTKSTEEDGWIFLHTSEDRSEMTGNSWTCAHSP